MYSWNVNGIRAAAKKGYLQWMAGSNGDVICVQEIKAKPEQLTDDLLRPHPFESFWCPAKKPGYSGLVTYSKRTPLQVGTGLGIDEFDDEGRVQWLEFPQCVVVNAYFPNSQREHARLPYKLRFCDQIKLFLDQWRAKGKHVVLCGDYNIAHQEIDLANPKSNRKNAGFLPEERQWMSDFLADDYVDIFRERNPDGGHYTWWSNRKGVRERNVGWRLDYHCVDRGLVSRVNSVQHHPQTLGSDHCPVSLGLMD